MSRYPQTIGAAKKVVYNRWAGNPKGDPYQEGRCAEEVGGDFMRYHQCSRKSGHGPGGLYCKQHAKKAEKVVTSNAQWKALTEKRTTSAPAPAPAPAKPSDFFTPKLPRPSPEIEVNNLLNFEWPGWRTMDSAPTDGTPILALGTADGSVGRVVSTAAYDPTCEHWCLLASCANAYSDYFFPSHWCPSVPSSVLATTSVPQGDSE